MQDKYHKEAPRPWEDAGQEAGGWFPVKAFAACKRWEKSILIDTSFRSLLGWNCCHLHI